MSKVKEVSFGIESTKVAKRTFRPVWTPSFLVSAQYIVEISSNKPGRVSRVRNIDQVIPHLSTLDYVSISIDKGRIENFPSKVILVSIQFAEAESTESFISFFHSKARPPAPCPKGGTKTCSS